MEVRNFSNVFDDAFADFKVRSFASEEIYIDGGDIVMRCDGICQKRRGLLRLGFGALRNV